MTDARDARGASARVGPRPDLIETFLLPPRTVGAWLADGVRVLGAASIIAAAIGWGPVDVAVFALCAIGLVAPRFLGLRPVLDGAFGLGLLVAAWSSVLDLYQAISWWDLAVHFTLNGLVAAVAVIALARLAEVPLRFDSVRSRVAVGIVTVVVGLAGGALWELGEWAGHTFVDETIFVGYDDTIGDIAVGALGSVVAAMLLPWLAARPVSGAHEVRGR